MYPAVVVAFAAMIFAWHTAVTKPRETAFVESVAADVAAANFWSYRSAVTRYLFANPSFSGTALDGDLTFDPGHVRNATWSHIVSAGVLYTYSQVGVKAGTMEAIARRGGNTLMIGRAGSGTMTSLSGGASGFALPTAIPAGAIVVIGD